MALYGWALGYGVCIAQDEPRGKQFLHQSKNPMARAWCILYRLVGTPDRNAGFIVLTTECDTSDPHVQYLLGDCYMLQYNTCAVDKGALCNEHAGNHIQALNNLAELLDRRSSPISDRQRGIALYRQAATQGYANAQYCLGECFERGIPGVLEKDIAQAKHWYSLSAAQRYLRAAHALGRLNS
eukprot:TRINITY_DN3793_c0_g2_i3.p1 TRINITY_DN3793_c0_g2~~TRINITY_DN3793_c0_g2_i3.p1  ORF type:complete len:212 (-),score=39.25 TRINITY_DN3793_c0_g2_i3:971-1519(-)